MRRYNFPRPAVGADGSVVGFVFEKDVSDLDTLIQRMHKDVLARNPKKNLDTPINVFFIKWSNYVQEWTQWAANWGHFQDDQLESFRLTYNRLRAEWIDTLKQTTHAPPFEPQNIPGGIGQQISSGVDKALLLVAGLGLAYIVLNRSRKD